jgi:hypothetical protein
MSGRLSLRALAFTQAALLLAMLLAPALAAAATIQTDLFVYNDGDTVNVTGVDYGPNEVVDFVTTDPDGTVVDDSAANGVSPTSDASGNVGYSFTLRATIAGLYTVTGTGATSQDSASTQFDPPGSPNNLQYVDHRFNGGAGIALSWASVSTADCYIVYRSTSDLLSTDRLVTNACPPALSGKAIAAPTSNSYTDASAVSGTNYYYAVTAVKTGTTGGAGESSLSNHVTTLSMNTSTTNVSFTSRAVGTTSSATTVTVPNNGLSSLKNVAISVTGDFAVSAPSATSVATGANFTFTITFTPTAAGARNGVISVDSQDTAQSGSGVFNRREIPVSGTGQSTAPTANNDSATVTEDSSANAIDVLANDTDPDTGDTTTVTAVGLASHGTAAVGALGANVTYTPAANYCGADSFTYTIKDATASSSTATVTVTVTCVPDPPTAHDDSVTTNEDQAANNIDVLGNDTDPDVGVGPGDTLSVVSVGAASHGTASMPGGNVKYTPGANYCGADSFTYTMRDAAGATSSATVHVTINCVNDGPTANADSATVAGNSVGNAVDVLANDTDPDSGDTKTVASVTAALHGTASVGPGGFDVRYTPTAGYCGADTFNYTMHDAAGATSSAAVSITVSPCGDTSAPTGVSILIDAGAVWTKTLSVSLGLSASDDTGIARYRLAETQAGLNTALDVPVSPAEATFARASVAFSLTAPDGASKTVWLRVCDAAANCSDASDTIGLDRVAPTITGSADRAPNSHGWYKADVTVSFNCGDDLSGVDTYTGPSTLGEGANQSVPGSCSDLAGNSNSASVAGINIDETNPSVSGAPDRAANSHGWYKADVTVTFSCSDALSGVDTQTAPATIGEGADQSVPGSCTDKAGNTANTSVDHLNIDETAPTITLQSRLPGPNGYGWNNATVIVTWACTDLLSGTVSSTVSDTKNTEAANQTATGTCADLADNSQTANENGINIDLTNPTITYSVAPSVAGTGWWNMSTGAPTVTFSCNDLLSGVATCTSPHPFGEGAGQSFTGTADDKAGNSASTSVTGVSVDLTAPSVICGSTPTFVLNQPGATVGATVSDATSGPLAASVSAGVGTTLPGQHSQILTGYDVAGNHKDASCPYLVGYNFTGLSAPVDKPNTLNISKAGQAIPLKWRLTDYFGNGVTNITNVTVTVAGITCDLGVTSDQIEEYAAGSSGLQNLGSGYYQFNWKTPSSYQNSCKTLGIDMGTGVAYTNLAYFKFTK